MPAPTTHGPGATASGSIFRRIVGPDRVAVPETYPGQSLVDADGSRSRARRATRHRPRDRRSPGRVARPARAAADDRGRHEARPAGRCHDDLDRPRRPARDDRLGGHPGRRRRAAARLPPRRGLGRGGPADRPGAGPARRPRGRRLRHRAVRGLRGGRPPERPADVPRPGDRRAVGGDPRAAVMDERRRRVHLDPRDPRRDRAGQRRAVRADGRPGRPARGAAGGVGATQPCDDDR